MGVHSSIAPTTGRACSSGSRAKRTERELTVLASTTLGGLSADGRAALVWEPTPSGPVAFLFRRGEPNAVRLADGYGSDLAPDARSALVLRDGGLYDVPVGVGVPRRIDLGGVDPAGARFVQPDAGGILVVGQRAGSKAHLWIVPRNGGSARPIGPEASSFPGAWAVGVRLAAASLARGELTIMPLDGGPVREIHGLGGLWPAAFTGDDSSLLMYGLTSCDLANLDLATERVTLVRRLGPSDRTGLVRCLNLMATADGNAYAYQYNRVQGDVILAEGLR